MGQIGHLVEGGPVPPRGHIWPHTDVPAVDITNASRCCGLVAEWLACWTRAQKGPGSNRRSGNSLRQTVHTRRASVHQAAKLVAALLKVAMATAGPVESNGRLPQGL